MSNSKTRYLIGAVLVFIGLGLFLDQWGVFRSIGYSFWFIITFLWGFFFLYFSYKFWNDENFFPAMIFFVIGIGIIFQQLFNRSIFEIIWPLFIVGLGISMITKRTNNVKVDHTNDFSHGAYMKDEINDSIMFWGVEKKIESDNFKGGKINCMFGSEILNIRNVMISKEKSILDISCMFGEVKIKIPKNCRIDFNGNAIFGSWDHRYNDHTNDSLPVLKITGNVLFGSVEIID